MTVRVCMVGCGAIAAIHAAILRTEGSVLHTVVGRDPLATSRFADQFGFMRHTTDLDAALGQAEIDAVVVTTPNHLHFAHARMAIWANKHVLVEIPLAMSHREAVELVDLAHRRERVFMVAHSERFIPSLAQVRARVASGQLHLYHLTGRETCLRRDNIGWTGRRRSWTDNLLWHFGGHAVDFSLWMLGATEAEIQSQEVLPDPRTGVPMDIDILLKTAADQLVSLSLSFHSHFQCHEYLLIGEETSYRFDRGRLEAADGLVDDPAANGLDYYQLSWEAQDREFLTALREERQPLMSGADALPAMAILQAIEDRMMAGRSVT